MLQRAFRVNFAERDLAVVSHTHLWRSDMASGEQKTVADENEDERMRRGEERKRLAIEGIAVLGPFDEFLVCGVIDDSRNAGERREGDGRGWKETDS